MVNMEQQLMRDIIYNSKINFNKYFQQIVLACKGWNSEKYSVMNTISRITSQYLGVKESYINQREIYNILLKISRKIAPREVDKMFTNMFDAEGIIKVYNVNIKLIGIIAAVEVSNDIGDLIELIYDENIMNGVVE